MLSIRLGDHLYSLPGKQVRHIDYVDNLTLLPMTSTWIEGLVCLNGLPIMLIDPFEVLGLQQRSALSRKCVFVHHKHMDFALRVDEVSRAKVQDNLPSILALLALKKRLPLQLTPALIKPAKVCNPRPAISVFVLVSGDTTLAIPCHQIDSIRRIEPLLNPSDGEVLLKLDDQVIPVYSLGQLLAVQTLEPESYAMLIKGKEKHTALCVEHVQGIESVEQIYTSSTALHSEWQLVPVECVIERMTYENLLGWDENPPARYWYITGAGQIRELLNIEHLLTGHYHPHQVNILRLYTQSASVPINKQQATPGLQFFCGTESYFAPMAMVDCVLETLDEKRGIRSRPNGVEQIPKLDARLLLGLQATESACVLVLRLADHVKLMLAVDRVLLSQAKFIADSWLKFDFPDPLNFLFDAVCYDESEKKWILRLNSSSHFAMLPWRLKKDFVRAIQGWYPA